MGYVIQEWVGHVGVGVGHAGVEWVKQGWGGSCRGEVGHAEVGVDHSGVN